MTNPEPVRLDEAPLLAKPCPDCERVGRGTYEIPGRCSNCGERYTLQIPRSHDSPGSMLGWECPNCGCYRVGATS